MGVNLGNSREGREEALREWESQTALSIVAEQQQRRKHGALIAAVTAAALVAVWYTKSSGAEQQAADADPGLAIAGRKPVPKLKEVDLPDTPESAPPTAATPDMLAQGEAAGAQWEAQRRAADALREENARRMRDARLKSALIASTAQAGQVGQPPVVYPDEGLAPPDVAPQQATQPQGAWSTGRVPYQAGGAGDTNSGFARAVSGTAVPVSRARRLAHLDYKVLQGKLIEAVLESEIVSDLPGTICATVQRDVYGAQGRLVLIPWGARVCGVYNAEVRKGQQRLFVVWNTLRRPDGVEVTIDSPGADQLGRPGMAGKVDTHFGQIFGASALLSIIGAGAANAGVDPGDRNNSSAHYRQSVQGAAAQTSTGVLQSYAAIAPTITVPAGAPVRIYVSRDLDFSPVDSVGANADDNSDANANGVQFIP